MFDRVERWRWTVLAPGLRFVVTIVSELSPCRVFPPTERVPDEVKKELLSQIRAYLQSQTSTM